MLHGFEIRLNNSGALHNKESKIKTPSQFAFSNDLYTIFVGFIFTLLISKLTYSKFYGTKLFYNPEMHGDQIKDLNYSMGKRRSVGLVT